MNDFRNNDYTDDQKNVYKYHYGDDNLLLSVQTISSNALNKKYCHSHEEYQFMAPITMMPSILINGKATITLPGKIYFFNSFSPHGITEDIKGMSYTRVIINKSFFETTASAIGVVVARLPKTATIEVNDNIRILTALYKKECRRSKNVTTTLMTAIARVLLSEFIHEVVNPQQTKQDKQIQIEAICNYMAQNCEHQDITVDSLAERVFMSKYHFIRTFCKEKNTTPMAFLTMTRIYKARTLLEFENESVASVAEKCGFASADYFSKVFKKEIGMSPLKYRALSKISNN